MAKVSLPDSTQNYIKQIEIIGLFNRFDLLIEDLKPDFNTFYGTNGSGKTTVLHAIANALNGDYERFLSLDFNRIEIIFNDDSYIKLLRPEGEDVTLIRSDQRRELPIRKYNIEEDNDSPDFERQRNDLVSFRQSNPFPKTSYFPAFRSIIEAWNALGKLDEQDKLSRQLFGNFVPSLKYLSIHQIEKELRDNFSAFKKAVNNRNQEVLSQSFGDILLSFSKVDAHVDSDFDAILQEIEALSKEVSAHPLQSDVNFLTGLMEKAQSISEFTHTNSDLSVNLPRQVLTTYRDALQNIVNFQIDIFKPISNYIDSVNTWLQQKQITINPEVFNTNQPFLGLVDNNGIVFGDIQLFSSGERQIFTLMYAVHSVTQSNANTIVLIDEPEISLHINGQTRLVDNLFERLQDKQIIISTHSQRMAGMRRGALKEIKLTQTNKQKWLDSPAPVRDQDLEKTDDLGLVEKHTPYDDPKAGISLNEAEEE
ncbi:AAA family ATPase [Leptothoe sp. ISB3NOV94-8A]